MEKDKFKEKIKIQWAVMNVRLSGGTLTEENAAKIAGGEYVLDASLAEHLLIGNLLELIPFMETLLDLQEELSVKTLGKFYQKVSGGKPAEYRKSTPVLFHLSYNPVIPAEIEDELEGLFREIHRKTFADPLEKAAFVHDNLIRIYPFADYNEIIARTAMEYVLLSSGEKMYPITLSESQYNSALAEFLRFGSEKEIYDNLKLAKLMEENSENHGL